MRARTDISRLSIVCASSSASIIADEMEKAVNHEMREVVPKEFVFRFGFPIGGLIRDDDVAQVLRYRLSIAASRK